MGSITYLPVVNQGVAVKTATPVLGTMVRNGTQLLDTPTLNEAIMQGGDYLGEQIKWAIHEAIYVPIMEGLKRAAINSWHFFLNVSYCTSLISSILGIVLLLSGVEEGKKITKIAVIVYIVLAIVEAIVGV